MCSLGKARGKLFRAWKDLQEGWEEHFIRGGSNRAEGNVLKLKEGRFR